jgi:sugar phosphate isomerase/epimerase
MIKPNLILSSRPSGGNYLQAAEFAVANQFDGIDWNLDYYRIPAASNAREGFITAAQKSGLPSRFHAPCQDVEIAHLDPEIARAALSYLKMYIGFIKVFPGTHLNLHVGSRSISESELSWETGVSFLKELVSFGKEQGVTVCIENLKKGWTSRPEKLAALVEATGAGITLDIGHARAALKFADSKLSVAEYAEPFAKSIQNVHLYEIESVEGRHIEPENLDVIRPTINWLLDKGILWWVIELTQYETMLNTKRMLEMEYGIG